MLLLQTQVFCNFTVLPEELNVRESFYISRQKLLVLILLWGFVMIWNGFYNEVLGECAASSG